MIRSYVVTSSRRGFHNAPGEALPTLENARVKTYWGSKIHAPGDSAPEHYTALDRSRALIRGRRVKKATMAEKLV